MASLLDFYCAVAVLKITDENTQDPDPDSNLDLDPSPDLLVRSTDLRIRIRTKMSRIRNTASSDDQVFLWRNVMRKLCD